MALHRTNKEKMPADLTLEEPQKSRYNVPALDKGLQILELLASVSDSLNVTQIALKLNKSTGEVYRLIQFLEWRGYIERDRDRDIYRLTFRLFRLAHEHPPLKSMISCASPIMDELSEAVGQSCHLVVQDGLSIVIVAQVDSPLPIRYSVRLGARFPIWEKSSGFLIAAYASESQRAKLFEQAAAVLSADEIALFRERVQEVLDQGLERRTSFLVPGITNLSCPVFDHSGKSVAALTIPYLAQRGNQVSPRDAAAHLKQSAAVLSKALGHSPAA